MWLSCMYKINSLNAKRVCCVCLHTQWKEYSEVAEAILPRNEKRIPLKGTNRPMYTFSYTKVLNVLQCPKNFTQFGPGILTLDTQMYYTCLRYPRPLSYYFYLTIFLSASMHFFSYLMKCLLLFIIIIASSEYVRVVTIIIIVFLCTYKIGFLLSSIRHT